MAQPPFAIRLSHVPSAKLSPAIVSSTAISRANVALTLMYGSAGQSYPQRVQTLKPRNARMVPATINKVARIFAIAA